MCRPILKTNNNSQCGFCGETFNRDYDRHFCQSQPLNTIEPKYIYVISMLRVTSYNELKSSNIIGLSLYFDKAKNDVLKNANNMWNGYYNYAVIERMDLSTCAATNKPDFYNEIMGWFKNNQLRNPTEYDIIEVECPDYLEKYCDFYKGYYL